MKTRTILALVLVVTLLVPGVAMGAVLGSPDLSAHMPDNRVSPGEETSIGIVLQNSGDLESSSATNSQLNQEVTMARGVTVDVNSGDAPIEVNTGTQAIGNLEERATEPIQFQIDVDEEAEPGNYRIPVDVEYDYTSYISEGDGARDQESEDERLYVTLHVRDEARFEVVAVDSQARVGETGTVEVSVENVGSQTARDADVTVSSNNAATTFGESQSAARHVDEWDAGEVRNLSFQLTTAPTADTASYSFNMATEYETPGGQQRAAESVSFGVAPLPEQSFDIESVESTLRVGDDGRLRGEVVNTANTTVSNVVLQWVSEQQNVSPTETEYAIGELGPGESAPVDFKVEVSEGADSGPRQFTFVTSYRDAEGDAQQGDELDVQAEVGPSQDEFDVEVVNGSVEAGDSSQVELRVTNAGEETLSDISAELFASSPISTTDSEAIVDELEPGESAELTFGISADSGALEKPYPLSMDFQYEEPDGDTRISDTYRFAASVTEPENDGGSVLPFLVVGLVVVALVVGYLRYGR